LRSTALAASRGLDPGWTRRHEPLATARRMRADPAFRHEVLEAFAYSGRGCRRDLVRTWSQAVRASRDPHDRAELDEALAVLRRVPRVELRFLRLDDLSDGEFHRVRRRHDLRLWLHHRPPSGPRVVLLSGPGPALASFERELGSRVLAEIPARRLVFRLDYEWAPSVSGEGAGHQLDFEVEGWEAAEVAGALSRDPAGFLVERIRRGEAQGYRWGVLRRVRWVVTRASSGEVLACGAPEGPLLLD
jgi:hypothetical protein